MEKGDDPYKILDITKTATQDEVKKAYRKLALKHHPDRHSDPVAKEEATHVFAKISCAYEILSDEKQRKRYDSLQEEQKKSGGKPKGFDERTMEGDFHFKSPYEVWKRDFEEQFGFPYPGAKYDFVDEKKRVKNSGNNNDGGGEAPRSSSKNKSAADQKRIAAKAANDDDNSSRSSASSNASGEKKADKPKGFFGRLFGRKNPQDETALVLHNGEEDQLPKEKKKEKSEKSKSSSSKKSSAPSSSSKESTPSSSNNKDTTLAKREAAPTETAIVKSYGVEGDNRPISMETTTKKIKHDDGTIETITEIKMVRPDGSIERCRTSDCAEKRKDWKQKQEKPKHKQLTNGEEKPKESKKLLTNGEEKPKKHTSSGNDKPKHKQLTNGESSSKKSSSKKKSSSSSSTALTVRD